jgi:Ni,Fe-hydrogenase I cytochrome b subunit
MGDICMLKNRKIAIVVAIVTEILLIAFLIGTGFFLFGQNSLRIAIWVIGMHAFGYLYVFIQNRIQKNSLRKKNV